MQDFTHEQLAPGIFQLSDTAGNCATLVCGEKSALLFDTMMGLGDLKAYIRTLTTLPLTVVNSHGHLDHIGGNYQFDAVYLSPKDWELIEINRSYVEEVAGNLGRPLVNCRRSLTDPQNLLPLAPGMVFDLGGTTARAIALPGHTAGCIGLLLMPQRILLAGDACTPQMCLFLYGAQPTEVYAQTLDALDALPFDSFILGHFSRLFPKRLLGNFRRCLALPGKAKGYPFPYTMIPEYTGVMYLSEIQNADAGGVVCIITKE